MKYWVAYDDTKRRDEIVAFHEDRDVVENYIESVIDITYRLGKCKSSELKKIKGVEGLYLVKHLDTYVQSRFYDLFDGYTEAEISDYKRTISVLERSLRIDDPEKSVRKSILNTIAYLKGVILEWEGTVPEYEAMQREYNEFELHQSRVWGDTMDFLEDTDRYLHGN